MSQIEELRGRLFVAPPRDFQAMGHIMGSELTVMKRVARRQARILLDLRDENTAFKGLTEDLRGAAAGTFPSLRTDVPEYPDGVGVSLGGFNEEKLEEEKEDREENEKDLEAGVNLSGGSDFCDRAAPVDRATRKSASDQFSQLTAVIVLRIVDAVAHDVCGQAFFGFTCSVCCIVTSVITGVAEGIYDSSQLCEGLTDGAELEAAFHNTQSIFEGVEHLNTDLATHDANIDGDLMTHDGKMSMEHGALSTQLGTHDDDIKGLLVLLKDGVDEANRQLLVSLAVQRELGKLLLTPEGRRETTLGLFSCDGDIMSCPDPLPCPDDDCVLDYPHK